MFSIENKDIFFCSEQLSPLIWPFSSLLWSFLSCVKYGVKWSAKECIAFGTDNFCMLDMKGI